VAGPTVAAAQVKAAAAGQLEQAPTLAAVPNIHAAAHLRQAPPGVAGPHVPAAQVKTLLPDNID